MKKIILLTGGVRSGKSRYAQELAKEYQRVRFIATAQSLDEEMEKRIKNHQLNRPKDWLLIEEPLKIKDYFLAERNGSLFEREKRIGGISSYDVTILDCITLWISNLLLQPANSGKELWETEEGLKLVEKEVLELVEILRGHPLPVIIVTNEVGLGGVQLSPLGRVYQDILGWTNQQLAFVSDEVYLLLSHIPLKIKG